MALRVRSRRLGMCVRSDLEVHDSRARLAADLGDGVCELSVAGRYRFIDGKCIELPLEPRHRRCRRARFER